MRAFAAVTAGAGAAFELRQLELGEPGPGDVLVRVVGTGICQTDLHVRDGTLYDVPMPAVLGHEAAGVVEQLGEGARGLRVGDAVVVTFEWCGVCSACLSNDEAYCRELMNRNYGRSDKTATLVDAGSESVDINVGFFGQSSLSEYVVCSASSAIPVGPVGMDDLPALGPLACSAQTGAGAVANGGHLQAGESVVVIGAGAVGLSAVMMAAALDAARVLVVEPRADRRTKAQELGATDVIDPADGRFDRWVRDITSGGADLVVDATGLAAVAESGLRSLKQPGRCMLVGAYPPGTRLDLNAGLMYGRTLAALTQGGSSPPAFIPQLVDLWRSGRFPIEKIEQRFNLDDLNVAAASMRDGTVVKPIIIPNIRAAEA